MDEDADWLRQPWENEPPRSVSSCRSVAGADALLLPLARAQDVVARLEASVAAAPDAVVGGLRARLPLIKATGFLAHCGPAVHTHDLALRDAHPTGSYTLAALAGRLREVAPWSMPITLRRRGVRGLARHGGRAWRHNNRGLRMTFGHCVVNIVRVVRPILFERNNCGV